MCQCSFAEHCKSAQDLVPAKSNTGYTLAQVVQTAGQAADPMAAYRPAAAALGASLIAGAVSNALLSTLTSWTAERFAARLKARLFAKIVSSDQAGASAYSQDLSTVLIHA